MEYAMYTHVYKQGEAYALELDVYLPQGAQNALPVVLYIHGGALIFGSRSSVRESELEAVLGLGMAYVSMDYRLAPETSLMEIKRDVRDALKWVRTQGAYLYNFDAGRVAVMGKSAGGYLALLSGTFANRPNAIVSFYGYGDILGEWYARPSPYYCKNPPVSPGEAEKCLQGGIPTHATDERWPLYLYARQRGTWAQLVSGLDEPATQRRLTAYCPIRNIDAQYPPTLLLHGSADSDVPVEQSYDMHAALRAAGIFAEIVIVPGAEHVFERSWRNTPQEFGRITDFLKKALAVEDANTVSPEA